MKKMLVSIIAVATVAIASLALAQGPMPVPQMAPVIAIAPTSIPVAMVHQAPITNMTSVVVTGFRPQNPQFDLVTGNWRCTAFAIGVSNRPIRMVSTTVSAADVLAMTGLVESNLSGAALMTAVQTTAIQKLIAGLGK